MGTREVSDSEIFFAMGGAWAERRRGAEHLHVRELGDGRAVYLCDMLLGNLRLAIGAFGSDCYEDMWCYQAEQAKAAWVAALGWDGEGDPEGWYRHPASGRRRPGGDASKQHVHW
jgi:hypothetical protein